MEIIENNINTIQYKTQKNKKTSDDYYHPTLRFITDGSVANLIKEHYIIKNNIINNDENNKNESNIEIDNNNYFDMILVDESHENNTNIILILTLIKFGIYINNSITLGIISATMEYDELIYRTYYNIIDDNYKYPLNIYNQTFVYNKNMKSNFMNYDDVIIEHLHFLNGKSQTDEGYLEVNAPELSNADRIELQRYINEEYATDLAKFKESVGIK